jgi:hypothetical protein
MLGANTRQACVPSSQGFCFRGILAIWPLTVCGGRGRWGDGAMHSVELPGVPDSAMNGPRLR